MDYGLNTLSHEQSDIINEQHRVATQIVDAKRCLAEARHALEEHDRPLRRRGHRSAIAHARRDVADLPSRLNGLEDRATELKEDLAANERSIGKIQTERGRAATGRDELGQQLDDDTLVRGEAASIDPVLTLLTHLGPEPKDSEGRARWIEAAGRVAQHWTLWPIADGQVIGACPRSFGQDDYATTHHRTAESLTALQRSRGLEPGGRDLGGLSL